MTSQFRKTMHIFCDLSHEEMVSRIGGDTFTMRRLERQALDRVLQSGALHFPTSGGGSSAIMAIAATTAEEGALQAHFQSIFGFQP